MLKNHFLEMRDAYISLAEQNSLVEADDGDRLLLVGDAAERALGV